MARPAKRLKREPKRQPLRQRCFLLEIPIEVRLLILDFVLQDTKDVTITVAELERNIFSSEEPDSVMNGMSGKYVPLVKNEFDPQMLSIGRLAVVPLPNLLDEKVEVGVRRDLGVTASMDSGYGSATESMRSTPTATLSQPDRPSIPIHASMSLLLTNKQLHAELSAHIMHPTSSRSTIHVTYPYGIIVMQNLYPSLVRYAEKVCISGWSEIPESELDTTTIMRNPPRNTLSLPKVSEETYKAANLALTRLLRLTLGPQGHPTLKRLTLRIFYPQESQYSTIWSSSKSPIPVALSNTCGGKDMKTWRGCCGNGVVLDMKPTTRGRPHMTPMFRRFRGTREREWRSWEVFGDEDSWGAIVPEGEFWSVG